MGPHGDFQFTEHGRRAADDDVTGFYRADAVGRSRINEVARIERVKLGGEFDQPAAIVDQLTCIAVLLRLAVDGEADRHVIRIRHLIGGHHPSTEHTESVYSLLATTVLS